MENRNKEKNPWSVPQFGGWDQKTGGVDYSMVFSRARANKKQVKTDVNRNSIENEEKLFVQDQDDSVCRKKRILTYFNCCIKA